MVARTPTKQSNLRRNAKEGESSVSMILVLPPHDGDRCLVASLLGEAKNIGK